MFNSVTFHFRPQAVDLKDKKSIAMGKSGASESARISQTHWFNGKEAMMDAEPLTTRERRPFRASCQSLRADESYSSATALSETVAVMIDSG